MPLDGVTIYALVNELNNVIVGSKIEKVQQPEKDKIILALNNRINAKKLLISCASGSARVNMTGVKYDNPNDPPMFCMLLRKHLTGGYIRKITQPAYDRIICLEIENTEDFRGTSGYRLIVELIGNSANIILTDAEGRIIDCLKRRDYSVNTNRILQPGLYYDSPPAQNKVNFIEFALNTPVPEDIQINGDADPSDLLMKTYSGLSPLLCREIAGRFSESGAGAVSDYCRMIREKLFTPVMLSENLRPVCFSCFEIRQYGSKYTEVVFSSFSELLDNYYRISDSEESKKRKTREIRRRITVVRERQLKKIVQQKAELDETAGREDIRVMAELIKSNIYRISRGDTRLVCSNYYLPDAAEVTIPLDPAKSPQQNADVLFKKYRKLKNAESILTTQINESEHLIHYLESVNDELDRAVTEKEIAEIRQELIDSGIISDKIPNNKRTAKKLSQADSFVTDHGKEVLVGRNNLQNDDLTFKTARSRDIWLHVHVAHGSHVILRCDNAAADEQDIYDAACLAAYYSQSRNTGKTAVDYTFAKNVKRMPGGLPGMVNYTSYKTIIVPSEQPQK